MGCDERALVRVLTSSKYENPWVMEQLVQDYNKRFMRDLKKDIESETRGDFETAALALVTGPLDGDVNLLQRSLDGAGTDEDALNDIILCRSNADIKAIAARYRIAKGRDLLSTVREDVNADLGRLYSMALNGTRAEPGAPVIAAEIDAKVTEFQQATEGQVGANAIAVAHILTACNDAQIYAIAEGYKRKYHRNLEAVIEKEFRGDMEDALLKMLAHATDRAKSDAMRLRTPLLKTVRPDRLFIQRLLTMWWDKPRLEAAKAAYRTRYGKALLTEAREVLSGDYEAIIMAIIGK